jgi:hypothetical protein
LAAGIYARLICGVGYFAAVFIVAYLYIFFQCHFIPLVFLEHAGHAAK